jgi:pimeloyl-ACP methyl ester carboxylesterase
MDRRTFVSATVATAASSLLSPTAFAQPAAKARNVVLVHGLFADGSSWSEVIPRLQAAGLNVTSVQNPLTTLPDAVASALSVLARQDGPTVLAGHSFSGMIVTDAGVHPNVSAVVYVAARAPDAGEDYTVLAKKFPAPPASAASFLMAMKDVSGRRLSCVISRATCRKRRQKRFTRFSGRSTNPCSPAKPPTRRGGRSPAGTRCRRRTGPSTRIWNASWPSAWALKRSRSSRATFP